MNESTTYPKSSKGVVLDGFFKDVKKGLYVDVSLNRSADQALKHFGSSGWQALHIKPTEQLGKALAKEAPKHIYFLTINVEDLEYDVLQGNDWDRFRPEMICVEAASPVIEGGDWRELLAKNGYKLVWNDGINDFYLAHESMYRKEQFKYVEESVLAGIPIRKNTLSQAELLERRLRDVTLQLEIEQLRSKQLQEDKKKLEAAAVQQKRLRNAAKLLARAVDRAIDAQIERLRVAKIHQGVRPNGEVEPHYDDSSAQKMLASIHNADITAYFTTASSRRPPQKFYAYKIVNGTYRLVRSGLAASGRGVARIIKGNRQDEQD